MLGIETGLEKMLDIESMQDELYYISAILSDNTLIHSIKINENHFQGEVAKEIFKAIKQLNKANSEINIMSISALLKSKVELSYIMQLMNDGSIYKSSFNTLQASILNNYQRRKISKLINQLNKDLVDGVEPSKMLGEVYNAMQEDNQITDSNFSISDVMIDTLSEIETAFAKGGSIAGMESGYLRLDSLINGFEKNKYILIAARPGVGKTAISLELTRRLAYKNKGLYFSIEMTKENLGKRLLTNISYVGGYKINAGKLDDDEFSKITDSAARISNLNLIINDKAGITVEEMCRIATQIKYTKGLDFIVVDYLQLAKTENRNCTTVKMIVDEVSGQLRELAKRLNICVIALAQLNRGVESRADKKPQVSDLKESGNLEQDANIILLLHSENDGDKPITFQDGSEKLNIIIGKNRDGAKKTLVYGYHKSVQRIEEKGIEVSE